MFGYEKGKENEREEKWNQSTNQVIESKKIKLLCCYPQSTKKKIKKHY